MKIAQNTYDIKGMSAVQRDLILKPIVASPVGRSADTSLKSGGEVALAVKLHNLPRAITVKQIMAEVTISPARSTSGKPVTQSSTVTEKGGSPRTFDVAISPSLCPNSLEVRLEGGAAFWNFTNVQTMMGTHDLPNFAEHVNTHLDEIEGPNAVLTFLVKADGPGIATIQVNSLDYTVIQTQTWAGDGTGTARQDRDLTLRFAEITTITLDLPLAGIGDSHRLAVVNLDVKGELGPERVLPSVIVPEGHEFATISADYFIAQEIFVPPETFQGGKTIDVIGVACSFFVDEQAQIHIGLYEDVSGMPAQSPLLAQAPSVSVSPDAMSSDTMTFAAFDKPAWVKVATKYWIVFKGVQGVVQLGLNLAPHPYLGTLLVNRGGQRWKFLNEPNSPQQRTVTHLIYAPTPETQTAPMEILVSGGTVPVAVKVTGTTQTVHANVPDSGSIGGNTSLIIRSRAEGTLNVSNITREYLPIDSTRTIKTLMYKSPALSMRRGVIT